MPNLRYELHHKICNLRYGTHGYEMSAYKGGNDKMQSFSMSCDSSMIRAHLPEFHLWVLPLVFWIDGFSQLGYCMLHNLG